MLTVATVLFLGITAFAAWHALRFEDSTAGLLALFSGPAALVLGVLAWRATRSGAPGQGGATSARSARRPATNLPAETFFNTHNEEAIEPGDGPAYHQGTRVSFASFDRWVLGENADGIREAHRAGSRRAGRRVALRRMQSDWCARQASRFSARHAHQNDGIRR